MVVAETSLAATTSAAGGERRRVLVLIEARATCEKAGRATRVARRIGRANMMIGVCSLEAKEVKFVVEL